MNVEKSPIILVLVCGFLLCCIPLTQYEIPLSWEGFYHARIAQSFAHGDFYDSGSFGPEGRPHVYPPVFHVIAAGLMKAISVEGEVLALWVPPFVFCVLILVWYLLVMQLYSKNVALLSSLLLLAVPAFVDLGFLFSPHSIALIFVFSAFFFLDRPVISGILGGLVLMTQFSAAFYFFLVIIFWCILDPSKRSTLKTIGLSLVVASPYLGYFVYHFPSFNIILGNLGAHYFFLKTTFIITALAVLGLRKDSFALSLGGAGFILSVLQPTNFCYLAFPLALFSALFVCDFFSRRRLAVVILAVMFWVSLIPSQEYVAKMQPAASEYQSFVWLKDNAVPSVIASGWYQAPIIASVSESIPVLGFGFSQERRIEDMNHLYNGDTRLLDLYDISYVYFGDHEAYDYGNAVLPLDRVYSGKGAFYKREPPLIYVLITVDVEPDLPPVLSSYRGMEEGLPYLVDLLDTYGICATFFVLGETAEAYSTDIAALGSTHEIGCHGLYHEDMKTLSREEKIQSVEKATNLLRDLTDEVTSFRAPGHSCDTELIDILIQEGYLVEASACKQFFYPYHPSETNWLEEGRSDLLRVPISHTPSYFYAPLVYPREWTECYLDALEIQQDRKVRIIVIGLHPWEFVELEAPGYELYTQACGKYTRVQFEQLLEFLYKRRVTFLTMRQLYELWGVIEEEWVPV